MGDQRLRLVAAQKPDQIIGKLDLIDQLVHVIEREFCAVIGKSGEDRLRARSHGIPRLDGLLLRLSALGGEEDDRRVPAGEKRQYTAKVVALVAGVREDQHHLWLRLLRLHDTALRRRRSGIVHPKFADGERPFPRDSHALAAFRQLIIFVDQVGICSYALQHRARAVLRLDPRRFRCGIPGDIQPFRAGRQRDVERFTLGKRDAGIIAVVRQPRGKTGAVFRQSDGAAARQIVRQACFLRARGAKRRRQQNGQHEKSGCAPKQFRT